MSVFWERFSMICDSYNQTPNVVAEKLGIASSIISAWEKGSIPNEKQLLQLSSYFGKRITYFLSDDLYYGCPPAYGREPLVHVVGTPLPETPKENAEAARWDEKYNTASYCPTTIK